MSADLPNDHAELMRDGVRVRVARLAKAAGTGARRWSPPALLAVLAAGAFGPLLLSGLGAAALVSAAVGAATAVGGNVLTDVLKAGVTRIGPNGGKPPAEGLEAELERQFQQVLEAGGQQADLLREQLADILRQSGAVGAAIEEAIRSGDRELQASLAAGLARLGEEFGEFGFVLAELGVQLRSIREGVDRLGAEGQLATGMLYRQATDTRLLLEQVAAIERRTRPDRAGTGQKAEARWRDGSPYRGLMPFTETAAEVFYGRETATAELVSALSRQLGGLGLLLVTGASGVGKSSLLRAGLMPAVGRGELSEAARHWPRHTLDRPTSSPLSRLAILLAGLAGLDAPTVLERLAGSPERAHLLVRQAVEADARRRGLPAQAVAECRLLLVLDQFEEIFTLQRSDDRPEAQAEREAFFTALHSAATVSCGPGDVPAALVVVALRGDFIDRCAEHPQLVSALRGNPFVLAPMGESDLRRTITGPADAAGLDIEPGLVDAVLAELRTRPGRFEAGALPLVSQAMFTTWEHLEGNRLTSRGYARTGGVTHAVATSAEAAYRELDAEGQETARRVFHQLTLVSRDGVLTRRAVPRTALHAGGGGERGEVERVLEVFAQRRLLVVDTESVQAAHDVLLTAWPRLRGWLEADLAGHALYGELVDDAAEWHRRGRQAAYLYRGEHLANLLEMLPRWQADPDRYPALPGVPQEFLEAGSRSESRAVFRRRTLLATLSILLVVALAAAGAAVRSEQQAIRQRDTAVAQGLAAKIERLTADPALSALLAVAAWRISPEPDELRASLLTVLSNPGRAVLTGNGTRISAVAFSPDGRTLAGASGSRDDGSLLLWDVATRKRIGAPLTGHTDGVASVAFSPDGRTLASGGYDHTLRLWDVATRKQIGTPLTGDGFGVESVVFSPDGRTLASGAGETVRLWDVATRKQIGAPLTDHTDGVASVAFSPDGRTLASGGYDHTLRLWDVATRKRIGAPLTGHTGAVVSVAFSPDGRTLATRSNDGSLRLWDVATRKQIGTPLTGHTGAVVSVAFSPDGRTLVSTSDKSVLVWDVATRKQIGTLLPGDGFGVESVAFSPDGRTLATGSNDGIVRLWNVTTPTLISFPTDAGDRISAVFSPDGRTLATSGNKSVRLWDVATRKQIATPLTGHTESVESVAFSPDGRTLAAGSNDGSVRLGDVATRKQIGPPLTGHTWPVASIAFSPDGRTLATSGYKEGAVRLWDVATRKQIGTPLTGYSGAMVPVAFNPDGRTLATGGDRDGSVRLWDVATRKQIGPPLTGHTWPVASIAFSPDGRTLATSGDSDGSVRLWDVATRKQIATPLTGHTESVESVAFSPDGKTLVTAGSDRTLRLWDVATRKQIGAPRIGDDYGIIRVVFSPDGKTLATAGFDRILRLWDVEIPNNLPEALCAIAARSLTPAEWAQHIPEVDFRTTCP
ncbi:nSTAND1 domain-containing NTPase [Streptosporangium sp. NBC_01469]|uniref:nSTAND1 domain-containing NTPase n=1 Tax=Streptosporangium sp. NBC_01469 TaxID=2903898 RepID=UPI002E2B4F61|nr:AAA family ATPase [Streptosporangium sp. NBC_01469]